MKKLITLLLVGLLGITTVQAQTPALKTRTDGTFTQGDTFLAALKSLSIPYGVTNTLNGGLQRPGSLFYNTTESKLYVYNGTAFTAVSSSTDLSGYYTKTQVDSIATVIGSNVVHKSGDETIAGVKRFTDSLKGNVAVVSSLNLVTPEGWDTMRLGADTNGRVGLRSYYEDAAKFYFDSGMGPTLVTSDWGAGREFQIIRPNGQDVMFVGWGGYGIEFGLPIYGNTGTQPTSTSDGSLASTEFVKNAIAATVPASLPSAGTPTIIFYALSTTVGTGASISIVGDNEDGLITLNTGPGISTTGSLFRVNLGSFFTYPTSCTPITQYGNGGVNPITVSGAGSNYWLTDVNVQLNPWTTYKWYYHVGGY
jgi:hypothetical protein